MTAAAVRNTGLRIRLTGIHTTACMHRTDRFRRLLNKLSSENLQPFGIFVS